MRIADAALLAALAGITPAARAAVPNAAPGAVLGDWMTEDRQGVIRMAPCGAVLCGVIVGTAAGAAPNDMLRDVHGRPQCHLSIINGLRPGGDGRLHGTVTDPEDGRTYSAEVWVPDDGVLRLRGYLGLPILGSTQHWPPFHGKVTPDCHFHEE